MANNNSTWTNEEIMQLHHLKEKYGKRWKKISKELIGKSPDSIEKKWHRVNWKEFLMAPTTYEENLKSGKWTDDEMIRLDAYIVAGAGYDFAASKLNRSVASVERQFQDTNWDAWRTKRDAINMVGSSGNMSEEQKEALLERLVDAILSVCDNEFAKLDLVKEDYFLSKVNLDKSEMFVSFSELKERAKDKLTERGLGNPEDVCFGKGRYIVVGDSHGRKTTKEMFDLLENINRSLKPDKIIHVGHLLDDRNDISYCWGKFSNLVILAKSEELRLVQNQRNKFRFNFDIVLNSVSLGDNLFVFNQDIISDYVKTPLTTLDSGMFEGKSIVNSHRMEFATRCSNEDRSYFASPGCICEQHITKTIKQIDFKDDRIVKESYPEGYVKYRRMRHMYRYWEKGMLVVDVDSSGNHTIVPCQIKRVQHMLATSYFDKIITSVGVSKPDKKIFVNGDMHCDMHDINVLDIQEQICRDYGPDSQVNLGDTFNYSSLNHHILDRGGVILKRLLEESAYTSYVLKRVSKWAPESHLIYGNHERFARDFVEKNPQFVDILDFKFLCDLEAMGYKLTPLKKVLKIGSAKFIHGEMKMYGQPGTKVEKVARTFGKDVFIGHIHKPEIRFSCFSIGLTGKEDQDYNEPEASNWIHGFGLCNQFMGHSFLTSIAIDNNRCILNKKAYTPKNVESWKPGKFKARLSYEFEK